MGTKLSPVGSSNPSVTPDELGITTLAGYSFPAQSIDFANFAFADLSGANLNAVSSAIGVNFNGADLTGATL